LNREVLTAETYCNLGNVAEDQDNNEAAEEWRRKALHIFEKNGAANQVIHLGRNAEKRRDFRNAEELYRKALEIAKYIRNYEQEATCYARLGSLACQQCDYETSKKWHEKAFETHERRGDMDCAAKTCMSLGNLCLARAAGKHRDFAEAKKWFRKGLEID